MKQIVGQGLVVVGLCCCGSLYCIADGLLLVRFLGIVDGPPSLWDRIG